MNIEKYDKRLVTEFLLGRLGEIDTETFDELSITDDEFADVLESAENDLIDSYLHGELENDDLERFQANYLASPLRREKVEFARALQNAAEKHSSKISTASQVETSGSGFALWNAFSNIQLGLRLGMAALFIAFIGGFGWLLFNINNKPIERANVQPAQSPIATIQPIETPGSNEATPEPTFLPQNTDPEKTPAPNVSPTISPISKPTLEPAKQPIPETPKLASFVLLMPTRGAGNLQTIEIPAGVTDLAFRLPIEAEEFKSFRVVLKDQTGKILWQSGKVLSKRSALNIRFPAKKISKDIYLFSVVGIDDNNERQNIGNYSFRSVLK